ncbi:enoyl-CoA hydratase-related protein [Klenkia sp. LSe6-5]|uniref:Enoyl-CoA hydratase-related protein n=1 Tax=Klenkia sesuvii TaxID=3103137 RepID=A0ABU8DWU3_9ACTN
MTGAPTGWQTLLVSQDQGVATVTLNRPDKLNALSPAMFDELPRALHALGSDPAVRVVILTGAGRGFCAGMDLTEAATLPERATPDLAAAQERWGAATLAMREITVPVIAAVNGPAAGAGFSLALAADVRVAAPTAVFSAAFIRIGLSGGDVGSSWLLPRIVGLGRASEILLTGRSVSAEDALQMGMVTSVVAAEDLLGAAGTIAASIAAHSPLGIRLTKQVLQTNIDAPSLRAAMELENRNQVLTMATADMAEALAAFRAKRPAVYRNR